MSMCVPLDMMGERVDFIYLFFKLKKKEKKEEKKRTSPVTRLGDAFDELVQEDDLALLGVDLGAHVHRPNVRMIGVFLSQRTVVSLHQTKH